MKHLLTLITLGLCVPLVRAQDHCYSALPITAGNVYTIDAINGPEIPVPICAPNGVGAMHTEWYTYTPAQDYSLTVTTDLPQNAGKDTRFHIYSGACGSLDCVGGADDEGSNTLGSATVQVAGGLTYYIAFDDRWSNQGFDFTLTEGPPVVTEFHFIPTTVPNAGGAYAVVDMTGDFLDDVVSVSGTSVNLGKQLAGGGWSAVSLPTPAATHIASWSLAAGDLDNNGFNDLIYGSGDGASFMLANNTGTGFTQQSFAEYIFCQRTNMVDINADGNLDAFSCHDVDANVAFMNTGDGNGTLEFHQHGYGETCGNYGSIWVDYDNDHDIDLFIAKCGCDPNDLLMRNNGDGTFTNVAPALGLSDSHQSWSSAWGDFDNDGDMDMMIGSSGSAYQKLMRNNGNGTFTDVTAGSGFDTFGGTSIEWTTHDFNNDGWLDVLGGGGMMVNNGDMTFTLRTDVPGNGPIGDLNNDGFLDIVSGAGAQINSGNTNKWLTVVTIGTQSNRNGIGARVEVSSPSFTQVRDVKSGDGFRYMSSLNTHFGLGTDSQIDQVKVTWPSGIIDIVENPSVNSVLEITEGTFNVGMQDHGAGLIKLYPNPAEDMLFVSSAQPLGNVSATITDMTGKQALRANLVGGGIDISALAAGLYSVQLDLGGRVVTERFNKR